MRPVLLLAVLVMPIAGCHSTGTGSIPASLLTCSGRPVPPVGGTQRAVAGYVVDLAEAHADCEGKLGAVRGLVERRQ